MFIFRSFWNVYLGGDYTGHIKSNTPTHILALCCLRLNISVYVLQMKNINNQNRHFFMHYDDTCNHDTSCVGYEAIFANNFQLAASLVLPNIVKFPKAHKPFSPL